MDQLPFNENRDLARHGDKVTSHEAAASIAHDMTERHHRVLAWLRMNGPATDLEMAEAMRNIFGGREESARRAVRTLREKHGAMVPALNDEGEQITHVNSTGRRGVCWIVGRAEPVAQADTIAARVRRCVASPGGYVELDGRHHFNARHLLAAILDEHETHTDEAHPDEAEGQEAPDAT